MQNEKGECDLTEARYVCEAMPQEEIRPEIEHKKLENQMLARQIDLLEKAQAYRCSRNVIEAQSEHQAQSHHPPARLHFLLEKADKKGDSIPCRFYR